MGVPEILSRMDVGFRLIPGKKHFLCAPCTHCWFSGRIPASHAGTLALIPGQCKEETVTGDWRSGGKK